MYAVNKLFAFTTSWTRYTYTIPATGTATSVGIVDSNLFGLRIEYHLFSGPDDVHSQFTQWTSNPSPTYKVISGQKNFMDNTNNELYITGLQIEVGDTATSFEHRSIGDEMHRCQRYFYMCADGTRGKAGTNRAPICTGAMYNASNFNGVVNFPVEMRTTPSLYKVVGSGYFRIWGNGGSDGCNDVVLEGSSPQCGIANIYDGLSQTSGSATWATTDNAACRLGFQAEL